jgi:hypothetical protein
MIGIKKMVSKILIVLALMVSLCAFTGFVAIELAYEVILHRLHGKFDFSTQYENHEEFNRKLWFIQTGNRDFKIKRMNAYQWLFDFFIRDSEKADQAYREGGCLFAMDFARSIMMKNGYGTFLEWHLHSLGFSIWVSNHVSASYCLNYLTATRYFGSDYYGLENAARGYFNKRVDALTDDETAFLIFKFNFGNTKDRWNRIRQYQEKLREFPRLGAKKL